MTILGMNTRRATILEGIARGDSNGRMGDHLGISHYTVADEVQQLLAMFDAHNRTALVAAAVLAGALMPSADGSHLTATA